jgi:peptidoglycan/xylan/chitin deacetylase (PgdA/CDA1 family)
LHIDPWEKSIRDMLEIEKKYDVRSTLFFIPFKDRQGHIAEGIPAKGRAIKYNLADHKNLLLELEANGWEVGVHGLDAHISVQNAREELGALRAQLPTKKMVGIRMHWLFQSETLWKNLTEAGFYYDATYGNNDEVGFPNGHYQPFKKDGIWVIPINIQEGTLLGYWRKGALPYDPWKRVEEILAEAGENNAVVTILWHNHAFGVYHYHGFLYEKILQRAKADEARICKCIDIVEELDAASN